MSNYLELETIVADLRAAGGSWRQYVLAPPKDLLCLRSLVARGRAKVRPHGWTPSCVARLFARSLPNEIAWRVLFAVVTVVFVVYPLMQWTLGR